MHGTNVEDGTLQGYLKTLNLPFVGCDVFASGLGMDKYAMKIMLKEAGFRFWTVAVSAPMIIKMLITLLLRLKANLLIRLSSNR